MSYVDRFSKAVDVGKNGEFPSVPLPLKVLSKLGVSIDKGTYYLIAGDPGSGKSAFAFSVFGLLAYMKWKKLLQDNNTNIKLEIYIRSMERSPVLLYAKWACLYLYLKHGIVTDTNYVLGRKGKIEIKHYDLIQRSIEYFRSIENIHILGGTENPTGIWKHLCKIGLKYGELKDGDRGKIYLPEDENVLVLYILDHIGRVSSERGMRRKELVDKTSEYLANARDMFGISPVVVQQFNRNIGDTNRRIHLTVTPESRDLKDSGNPYEDCDLCLGIFDPFRYNVKNYMGYDIAKMVSKSQSSRFRGITILKNNHGPDGAIIGSNFIGECGLYKSLKRPQLMTNEDYKKCQPTEI